jgi:PAS domain S-box-containing protein
MRRDLFDELFFSLEEEKKNTIYSIKKNFDLHSDYFLDQIDSLPLATCLTDQFGIFLDVNNRYCALYGYSKEELLGKHFTLILPEEDKAWLAQRHTDFINGLIDSPWEVAVLHKSGAQKRVCVSASRIYLPSGEPAKVTFIMDVTNVSRLSKKIIEELEDCLNASRAREKSLEGVVKELSNHINTIQVSSRLMHEEMHRLPREAASMAVIIDRNARRANELLRYHSQVIHLQNNSFDPKPEHFFSIRELNDIVTDHHFSICQKNIQVRWLNHIKTEQEAILFNDLFCFHGIFRNTLHYIINSAQHDSLLTMKIKRIGTVLFIKIHAHIICYNSAKAWGEGLHLQNGNNAPVGTCEHFVFSQMIKAMGGRISVLTSGTKGFLVSYQLPDSTVLS